MMKRIPHQHEAILGDAAKLYEEVHEKHRKIYEGIARNIVALDIPGEYLEVGSGTGLLSTLIAEAKPDVKITALDLSPEMVDMSTKYVEKQKLGDRIRFLTGDASDEKVIEGLDKYNLVYSTFSLHHWEDPEIVFANLWKLVKNKGALYAYDFKRVWWLYYFPSKMSDLEAIRAAYLPREIRRIFQELDIKNYKIKTKTLVFQSITAWK
jgi:ubiquinone/menaquinone biosynthesis C-methylase UbiE